MSCNGILLDDQSKRIDEYRISIADIIMVEICVVDITVNLPTGNEKKYTIYRNKTVADLKEQIAVSIFFCSHLVFSLHCSKLPLSSEQWQTFGWCNCDPVNRSRLCLDFLFNPDRDSAPKQGEGHRFLGHRIQSECHDWLSHHFASIRLLSSLLWSVERANHPCSQRDALTVQPWRSHQSFHSSSFLFETPK